MPDPYDVIIAGAGPGGATAAYFLGEAKKRVLVLEKESLPRYKTCGGGLSLELLQSTFPFSFEPVIELRIRAMAYDLGGRTLRVPVPEGRLRTVMRDRFDSFILEHARAEVRPGDPLRRVTETPEGVQVETAAGNSFSARFLIGADGANSTVAHQLGLRPGRVLAAAIEAEVPASPEAMRRYGDALLMIFNEVSLGYLWIFPKREHLSIGAAALHPKPGELQAALARVLARYGLAQEGAVVHGHPIPIYTRRERISTARTLLVGDAAGLADPLSGEGIRLAITSGKLAAQALIDGRPQSYPALVQRHIGRSQDLAVGLAWLFYHFQGLCLRVGGPNPYSSYAFVDLLSGRIGYGGVLLRLFGTLPYYAAGRLTARLRGMKAEG